MTIQLREQTFTVAKVTPKGVWLEAPWFERRFVRLEAQKRFACPTRQDALQSLMARKSRQMRLLATS